jgi:uncharacterized protein (DUF934 family)
MSIVINHQGRFDNTERSEFTDIDSAIEPTELDGLLKVPAIRIVFSTCADGRFLTLVRQLRLRGYKGHIRAAGNLLPDQFPMALKLGVDSVEVSTDHAARCNEDQWIAHAMRTQANYQGRLAGQNRYSVMTN